MHELSGPARSLLTRRLAGERVTVTDETRPLYEELVDAGLMEPLASFVSGPRSAYRLTESAYALKDAC